MLMLVKHDRMPSLPNNFATLKPSSSPEFFGPRAQIHLQHALQSKYSLAVGAALLVLHKRSYPN